MQGNRMKLLNLMPILLVAAAPVFATTITATGNDGPNWETNACPGNVPTTPTCVIGLPTDFAIQSATFTVNNTANSGNGSASAEIFTNYGNSNLSPFTFNSVGLAAADMLISVGGLEYALVLYSHDSLSQGGLYLLTGEETAGTVLNNVSGQYRNTLDVWGNPTGAVLIGQGTVTVNPFGNGTSAPELDVQINGINPVGGHNFSALVSNGLTFEVASADCGNGVVYGAVPEPGTLALAGSALVGLVFLSRRRSTK